MKKSLVLKFFAFTALALFAYTGLAVMVIILTGGWTAIMVPLVITLMALVIGLSYVVINNWFSTFTGALGKIEKGLSSLNEGQATQIDNLFGMKELNGVISDINELSSKIAYTLDNLRYEQGKSNFILNGIEQGFCAIDTDAKILLVNRAFLNVFDMNLSEEAEGKSFFEFADNESLQRGIYDASKDSIPSFCELEKNGTIYRVSFTPVLDATPASKEAVAFVLFTDITEERLYQHIQNEFFTNASHELKTPLTSIRGFAELLGQMADDSTTIETRKKCVHEILKNSDRILNLIDNMMRLARLEAKAEGCAPAEYELEEIAKGVVKMLAPQCEKKNVHISIRGKAKLVAAKPRLDELIGNLIDNAVKYNKVGGSVKVNFFEDENVVIMTVEDTGIGIAKENHDRIFERFFMVDKSRTGSALGTGLGLSIVRHVALQLGGTIDIMSELDKGTTISVIFNKRGV